MSSPSLTPRLTRLTILAVAGTTALSIAACGSSNDKKPSASPTGQSAQPKAQRQVNGLIASVSGNAIQVTEKNGTAAVDFSPATKVTEATVAERSIVANGNCVVVWPTAPAAGGAVTAKSVRIVPAVNGKCLQPKARAQPAANQPLRGTVASVAGGTITVSGTDVNGNPSQTAVAVDDKTQYWLVSVANSGAIAQGKCITASGTTRDERGALQAAAINLRSANNGKC